LRPDPTPSLVYVLTASPAQGPTASSVVLNEGLDDAVVELLFANARTGEIITVMVAITLAASQWPTLGGLRAGGWLLAMVLVVLARSALRRAYRQRSVQAGDSGWWGHAFTVGAVATGLLWGLAGQVLMVSPALEHSFIILMCIAGMTSAAVPYLAPLPRTFHLYAAAAVLPTALRFLSGGTPLYVSIGALMVVYMLGIQRSAQLFGRWLREAHRLARNEATKAAELEVMTRELAEVHERAQAETARRLELERGRADLEAEINASLATVVDERTAELRQTLAAMTATREQLDSALVAGRLALFEVDTRSRAVKLSEHWSQMLGGAATGTITTMQELMLLTHADDRPAIRRAYRDALRGSSNGYVVDHRVRDLNGGWLWIESRARVASRDEKGRTLALVGTNCDISARKENESRLRHQAYHDPLTGLANRAFLRERLQEMIYRAERNNHSLAVLCLDLDHFKVINDSNGHAAGDQLLRAAAARLSNSVRQGDVVVRLGGDEFAVLLEGPLHTETIAAIARKILSRISSPITVDEHEHALSTSIGVSCFPTDGRTPDELLTRADLAMYSAKEAGRNDFRFFTAELHEQIQEKAQLMAGLQSPFLQQQLWLAYQPRVNSDSGEVLGVEALLRWSHPELGEISPERFIPLAEQTGIIVQLGEWALRTACTQFRAWCDAGIGLQRVAVNLSMRQLLEPDLVERIAAILDEQGLAPQQLELEITESMAMQHPEAVLETLSRLDSRGVRIGLDDFGTGYSSLAYLKRFPIDDLKIDRAFVSGVPHDAEDVAIARAILALARSLDLTPVAEGVETIEQRDFLQAEGCREMQGYLYGEPRPAAALQLTRRVGAALAG
jgi:diguanylate cyclase (GGDEF)-like protein/PAS domain S-box-containing protein